MSIALERVGPRHPEACQANIATGRCQYKAATGSVYSALHGGGMAQRSHEKAQFKNYQIETIHGRRGAQLANSTQLKDISDEIGILRLTMESILKNIQSETDFLLYSDKIISLTKNIQVLVESLQKIQERNKELVDRTTLMAVADGIIAIVIQHIDDPDKQLNIANEIFGCFVAGMGETAQLTE